MGTTFKELKRRVMIGFPRSDGEAIIAVETAINDAIKTLAGFLEFKELLITDTASAATVASQKSYHLVSDLALTRPKDIISIRIIDGTASVPLTYISPRDLDREHPYPEGEATGKPVRYTDPGKYLELYPVPDAIYTMYVRYRQWPAMLEAELDECPFEDHDTTIIFLAKDIANSYLAGEYINFVDKAANWIRISRDVINTKTDQIRVAKPFKASIDYKPTEPWKDPLVRR